MKIAALVSLWLTLVFVTAAVTLGLAAPATSQQAVPQTDPFLTACQVAADSAAISSLRMENCRKVAVTTVGNSSVVDLRVKIQTVGWFKVHVLLHQTTWSTTGFAAVPE